MDLLELTLNSFFQYNTYKGCDLVNIIEDDPNTSKDDLKHIRKLCESHGYECHIIQNEARLGQYQSLDILYSQLDTEWTMHCEDDWEFHDYGFIEDSMEVFEHYGDGLFTVNLWGKQINDDPNRVLDEYCMCDSGLQYQIINPNYILGGFNHNPGLRKTKVIQRAYPYAEVEIEKGVMPSNRRLPFYQEGALSTMYIRVWGYRSARICGGDYVDHIGWGKHVIID